MTGSNGGTDRSMFLHQLATIAYRKTQTDNTDNSTDNTENSTGENAVFSVYSLDIRTNHVSLDKNVYLNLLVFFFSSFFSIRTSWMEA